MQYRDKTVEGSAEPIVSVIVNLYNGEQTLEATLASIMAQTFSNFELVIWDDCSEDSSLEIARRLKDPRVRIFTNETNVGLGAARRAALSECRGQWIGFVDQDDLWIETKLAEQMDLVDKMPDAGFVFGRTLRFFPDGSTEDFDHRHEFQPLPRNDIFNALFEDSCFIAISAVLFRRDVILEIPEIPEQISACSDYFLFLQIARRYPVNATDRVVCLYRMHDNNMSAHYGVHMQQEILFLIDRWAGEIDADLANRRRRVHSTLLAFMQIKQGELGKGTATLLRDGSIIYLLQRPFVRLFRRVRRRIMTPMAMRQEDLNVALLLQGAVALNG